VQPLSPEEIRASFVNCSKGEAKRLPLPRDLSTAPWEDLDFLGWRDPGAPGAAYLVAPEATSDGDPVGLVLRLSSDRRATGRKNMCSLCLTVHSTTDVALMVAPRPGAAGRAGNTVGAYLCVDLACSLYARGRKRPDRVQPEETLTPEQKVARLEVNLATFVRRVRG
jgi:hypothetical protein